jgi:NADH-quinone oxidoreductase subunit F
MDLKHLDALPSAAEKAAIDALLGPPTEDEVVGYREAKARRPRLLPGLHALQDAVGRITAGGLGYLCRRLHVAPAEAYGVASFYALFTMDDRPATIAHVCDDGPCRLRGAEALSASLEGMSPPVGTMFARSPCLGLCEQAPAALLRGPGVDVSWGSTSIDGVLGAINGRVPSRAAATIRQPREQLHLLRRVGNDPTSLAEYRASGGYTALLRAFDLGTTATIALVSASGLVGRGGAMFPTGRKWQAVAGHPVHPHHLVCNADESEPGTFKDRVLLEDDPFAVIESVTLAAWAIGCEDAIIYLRGEYPLARERLEHAIAAATAAGLLGDDVLGRGVRVRITVFRGAGAYICGEETALLNSLEGLRGEPRQKPPFPADKGLYQEPTAVNNVETLLNVLDIVADGVDAWAARGVPGSPGTRLFCLSGNVVNPGVYEVGLGTPLSALIALAGVPEGRTIQAVLMGGAAGTFLRPNELDLPLTGDAVRKAGTTLGSGAVIVLDDEADLVDFLKRLAHFFEEESCGQCVPCRVGTARVGEWLGRCASGRALGSRAEEAARLADLAQVMRDASICGLGQTAASAIESAVERLDLLARFE